MNAVEKLRQMVGEIRRGPAVVDVRASWELVGRLLGRMPVEQGEAAKVCAARDIDALDTMISRLERRDSPASQASSAGSLDKEELERALKAFRKRLKVMRLAEESKLGGRQLTGGRKSEIDAILPPHEFPNEVWQALAREGKLKALGQGFYALP
jgi:hypothetical protein